MPAVSTSSVSGTRVNFSSGTWLGSASVWVATASWSQTEPSPPGAPPSRRMATARGGGLEVRRELVPHRRLGRADRAAVGVDEDEQPVEVPLEAHRLRGAVGLHEVEGPEELARLEPGRRRRFGARAALLCQGGLEAAVLPRQDHHLHAEHQAQEREEADEAELGCGHGCCSGSSVVSRTASGSSATARTVGLAASLRAPPASGGLPRDQLKRTHS